MSETENEPNEETEPQPAAPPEPEPEPEEEQEEHDATQPPEPPEPEEAQAQGTTPEQWEERFKKADRAATNYTKRISDLWEEDATGLVLFNFSPSAPPGFMAAADAGRVDEETKAGLLEWLGFAREQDYEPDPQTHECTTCKGKGKTKTGSHVAGRETRPCPACNGSGAEGLTASPVAAAGNGTSEEPFSLAPVGNEQATNVDNWDEPLFLPDGRENPNYGKQPQFKVLVEPYGRTAGLTAQDVAAGA